MARGLTFRHIEALRAMMLTGSVTGAAARLFVTQPAISHLIREIEDILGFALFDRRFGRLQATQRAELLFDEIERSFISLDFINDFSRRLRDGAQRTITLGAVPVAAIGVLPQVIRTWRETVADDFFVVWPRSSEQSISMVSSQKADLAIALAVPPIPGVCSEVLAVYDALCLLPPGHRLAEADTVTASDLRGEPMVITSSNEEGIVAATAEAFREAGAPTAVAECSAATAACAMVEAGIGFALLDPVAALPFRRSAVICKPFVPAIRFEFRAYWLEDRRLACRAPLIDLARRRMQEIGCLFHATPRLLTAAGE